MDFFDLLVRSETRVWNHVNAAVRKDVGRSLSDLVALRVIDRRGGDGRVDDLRIDLGVTVGAASKLVDRLARAGDVERRPHRTDRRSSLLVVTEEGRELSRAASQSIEAELTALLADENPADIAIVSDVLRRLADRRESRLEVAR